MKLKAKAGALVGAFTVAMSLVATPAAAANAGAGGTDVGAPPSLSAPSPSLLAGVLGGAGVADAAVVPAGQPFEVSAAYVGPSSASTQQSAVSPYSLATGTSGSLGIGCSGAGSAGTAYDYPHAAASSDYTTINAHLMVKCTAPVAEIDVTTQMCRPDNWVCGDINSKAVYGKDYARIGGDLVCTKASRPYEAIGYVVIFFPPGYSPAASTSYVSSVTRNFHKNSSGTCSAG